jgi:hypothetical protein
MSSGHHAHITLGQAKYNRTIAGSLPSQTVFRLDSVRNRKVQKEKEKKMGWFKRKFAQWAREAWENSRDEDKTYAVDSVRPHEGVNGKSSIRFTIYAASGGHIIEYYKNDRYKEHDGPELVIVTQGEELGKAVEHILTMEALKS